MMFFYEIISILKCFRVCFIKYSHFASTQETISLFLSRKTFFPIYPGFYSNIRFFKNQYGWKFFILIKNKSKLVAVIKTVIPAHKCLTLNVY